MSIYCYCDYDPPHFYAADVRTARKPHKCYDCSGHILPGERYERVAAIWERGMRMDTVNTCERCYDIRMWVKNNVPCFCYAHGGLDETASEAIADAYDRAHNEVIGLKFGYLRRIALRNRLNSFRRKM